MAGYLSVPIDTAGGVTTPSGVLAVTLPTADADTLHAGLPTQVVEPPGARMVAFSNGYDRPRLLTKATIVKAGGLAPSTAPTLATTGVRATATITYTTEPNDQDEFDLSTQNGYGITVKTVAALTTTTDVTLSYRVEVKTAGSRAATLARIVAVLNGDSSVVEGTHFHWRSIYLTYAQVIEGLGVTASVVDTGGATGVVTLTADVYGTGPNAWLGTEITDGTGDWAITNFSGGVNGTGTAPTAGRRRYFYTSYRDADGCETGPSPEAEITTAIDENIAVSGLTANADTSFDYTRLYRTRDTGTEFILCKTIARAATTVTDDISDDRLEEFGEQPYDENLYQSYREGFPPVCKYLAVWKNRLWGIGAVLAADYTRGTAAVTITTTGLDNATVTLTGAYPTQAWVGRKFQVASTSQKYKILKVDEATKVLTLDRGYEGLTNATASYTVRDERDPSQLYGSEPGLWNLWPDKNNPGGVDTDDSGGGTGIIGFGDSLVVTSKSSLYRLTGDDEDNWQFHKAVEGFGCVEGRTLIDVPDFGLMWLGLAGINSWSGSGLPSLITSPQRRGKFVRGIQDTIDRINWPHVSQAFAHYSQQENVVRFFVPLDDDVVPKHAIVLEIASPGDWSLDHFPMGATEARTVTGSDGKPLTVVGTQFGTVHHFGLGSYDTTPDMSGIESVVTLTAGTVRTATQAGTTWPTTNGGLAGLPCLVVYAAGTAVEAVIASNTSGALTFAYDLTTAPASGDQVVVGGVWTRWRSGRFALEEDWSAKVWKDVVVSHSPEADGQYHIAFSADQGDTAIPTIGYTAGDLTATSGRRRFRPQARGQLHQIEYNLIEPGTTGHIRGHQLAYTIGAPARSGA